jgi:hypothetical protein
VKKKLVLATLAAVLVAVTIGIYRAGDHELPAPSTNADIVFHGGSASGRRITTKSWSANYDRIVSNADQTMLVVDGVHDGVIDKKGKPYLRVRAQHVTVNTISSSRDRYTSKRWAAIRLARSTPIARTGTTARNY